MPANNDDKILMLGFLSVGIVFLYGGMTGKSTLAIIQSLVKGKTPGNAGKTQIIDGTAVSGGSSAASSGTVPEAPAQLSANEALGKTMAAAYGWTGTEWNALYDLWNRESGWNNTATNPTSGAYGIPQALPASKMYGGTSSPALQIQWGLSYIKSTYGTPSGAWAHEQSAGWY